MKTRNFEMEFVYMDSYWLLYDGAAEAVRLLEAGKGEEALDKLKDSMEISKIVLEKKIDPFIFKTGTE